MIWILMPFIAHASLVMMWSVPQPQETLEFQSDLSQLEEWREAVANLDGLKALENNDWREIREFLIGVPPEKSALLWNAVPREDPQAWEFLAERFRTPFDESTRMRLATYHENLARLEQEPLAIDPSERRRIVEEGTALFAERFDTLAARQERDRQRLVQLMSVSAPSEHERGELLDLAAAAADYDLAASELRQELFSDERAEQLDYTARSLVDGQFFAKMDSLQDVVVSIWRMVPTVAGGESVKYAGTGFWYRGRVLTAAHVIYGAADNREIDQLDWSQVKVVLHNGDGLFDPKADPRLSVAAPAAGSTKVLWEWDVACLEVTPTERISAEHIQALGLRFGGGPKTEYDLGVNSQQLDVTVVHGLACAERAEGTKVYWIQPGPVLFPLRGRRPAIEGKLASAGPAFKRAVRNELVGRIRNATSAKSDFVQQVQEVVSDLLDADSDLPSYSNCNEGDSCLLRYRADRNTGLLKYAKDARFLVERRIECFGSDLLTMPGTSGAPIFLLNGEIPTLVGLHTSRRKIDTKDHVPAALAQIERAVPFYRFAPLIEDSIPK